MNATKISLLLENTFFIIAIIAIFFILSIVFIIRSLGSYDNKYEYLKISFSNKLYTDYLKLSFNSHKRKALIYIYLHNGSGDYEKDNIIKKILGDVYNRYFGTKGLKVFRIDVQTLAICIENLDLIEEVKEDFKKYLDEEQEK